jgi:hypothetical protein
MTLEGISFGISKMRRYSSSRFMLLIRFQVKHFWYKPCLSGLGYLCRKGENEMKLTKEEVITKLGEYTCPQGECMRVAKEMMDELLEGENDVVNNQPFTDVNEVIVELKRCTDHTESLATIWPATGWDPKGNVVYHSLIVFNTDPLQSVAAWESGIEVYDEEQTKGFIERTIKSDAHGNKIDVQQNKRKEPLTIQ